MNNKRMGKHAERIQRFVYKKINKQLISVAGSVLIVLGSYAIVPLQVFATETATEEVAQAQPNTAALPTVASSELASETPPPTANQEGAAQETPPTTTDDAKAQKETESKSADEEKKSDEMDQQADTAKTRAQPQPRANTTSEGWEYENRGTYVEITNYTGNLVNITVPAKIEGKPVEINLGTVLKEKMANENEAVTQTFKIESAGEGGTPVKVVGTFETLFARSGDPTASYSNNTLISVDFGNADCSEIRDMSSMFGKCTQLQELDLSGWNTSKVVNMYAMFNGCTQLKDLNLTGWNTSNVENMSEMFFDCTQLKDLNLSGWHTSQVQDMYLMFYGSNNLSTLTLSSDFEFKANTRLRELPNATSRWVKDDSATMYDSTAAFITAHNDLTEPATNHTYTIKTLDNPTAEGWGFDDKGSYMEITSYNGDPTNITVPAKIYGKPVEINLGTVLKEKMAGSMGSSTETFKIERSGEGETPVKVVGTFEGLFMEGELRPNTTLTSVDFGNADCSGIKDMNFMFGYCTELQKVDLAGWDTSLVENMRYMFTNCNQLQELNLSGWNTNSVQTMEHMFVYSGNLSTLTLSSDFEFKNDTYLRGLPDAASRWVKDDFVEMYDSTAAFIAAHNDLAETATNHTYKIKTLDNPTAEGWGFEDKGTYMEITSYNGDPTHITVPAKIYGKPVEINLGTVLKNQMANENGAVTETFKIESAGEGETPVKLVGTFKDLFARPMGGGYYSNTTLTFVDFGNADSSEIQDMSYMFSNCSQLRDLNVTGWNTNQVQDMKQMFYGCSELKELNVSGLNTSNVQSMDSMFSYCSQLKDLNLSGWNTSQVQDMRSMFNGCSQLQDLNVTGLNTSQVQDMRSMFSGCSELKELDLTDWNTNKVENMSRMFNECSQLKDLNLSDWDTSQLQDMDAMFLDCSELKELDLTDWNTSNVENMRWMFGECSQLQDLNLSGWNTSNVLDMGRMFYYSNNLSKLTLSSDFKFKNGHELRDLPNLSGKTTYHWVKDDYEADYDSTADFTTAHNNLTGASKNHVYTIQKKHKVSFDLNGGSGNTPDPQYIFESKSADKPDYKGTKGDLIFDEWTFNGDPFIFDTPITEPIELTASWRKARYTIKFDANKGEGTMSDQELSVDEEQQLPANQFTRNGYDFGGWNKESDGGGDSYSDKEAVKNLSTTEGAQVKLYAQWNPITYTVTFDSKDGSQVSDKEYTIEKGIDSFETPTRTGYTFEGWYDGEDKITKIETGETGNRTLEAKWKLETYKVTFNSKGGTSVPNETYTIEKGIDSFAEPQKDHYTFEGWYDGEDKVTKIEKGETGDRTLIAKWTPVTYKVTFNSNGGTHVSEKEYTIETGIDTFKAPTRTGYTFEGWYDGQTKVESIPVGETGNRSLEAKWKIETYTVTFDSNDGSAVSQKTYTIEKGIDSFETPTRTGYTFEGWYDGEDKVTKIEKGETGDRTLIAKWTPVTYKVTFDSAGGSQVQEKVYTIEQGIDKFVEPTKAHYTFDGWYDGEDKVTKIEKGETGNRTLIAKWTPVTYTVTFNSNGGTLVSNKTYTIEKGIDSFKTPTRSGYTFEGWYDGEEKVTKIEDGDTGNRALEAKWKIETYTVTFDSNDGSSILPKTYTIEKGIASFETPIRSGYTFEGWYDGEDKVTKIEDGETGNRTLIAKWIPVTYKVTFDSAGGSQVQEKAYTIEQGIDKFVEPTKAHYTFDGWYNGEKKVTKIEKGETGDLTLIAKWTPVTYKVTFNSNGGSPVQEKAYTIEQGIDKFASPTRTGYTFDGWYDGEEKVTKIEDGETGNRALEARWKLETYKVTFDSNGGSKVSEKEYTIEKGIDSFVEPTKAHYTFDGWYDGKEKVTNIKEGETGNRTLIAKWTPVTYKVTFDSAGGNAIDPMPYTIEETISTLPTPTRKGHKFMGWFEGENLVTEIPIGGTSNRTLTAKWEIITYTITFEGEVLSPITYTISDQSIALPDGPERAGYRFLGWLVSEDKLNRSTQSTNSIVRSLAAGTIGNLRLTAQYEAIKYTVTFDSAGGSAIDPISFTTENSVTKLPEPGRIGYRFLGWYDGETKVTELPKGTIGDKTLTAKWEKIKSIEVIGNILKEEKQKNRKEQDYTEDSWKVYQEAKKAAEDLLKEVNPDPLKAEQILAKLQAAIKGLTLKDATAPTPVGTTNIPVSKKVYPTAQAKQYPRTNMITTIWPGFIGTGLVAAVIALIKKNKK
ncbi:InlB B-repeat-containing protein [Enterococcus hulanensis]|uniref:InlB B-repeat-containing protein n=1 Tax=Enterococcus hulanensis TaxID=2559929 RepID=UPI00148543C1|nr:InlB B-repeat-containing protein [Enterococcus hulanensis]